MTHVPLCVGGRTTLGQNTFCTIFMETVFDSLGPYVVRESCRIERRCHGIQDRVTKYVPMTLGHPRGSRDLQTRTDEDVPGPVKGEKGLVVILGRGRNRKPENRQRLVYTGRDGLRVARRECEM